MKKIFTIAIILIMVFALFGCSNEGENSNESTQKEAEVYDIQRDIEFVKSIFECKDIETLAERYTEEIIPYEDMEIKGSFANIKGVYEIEVYGEDSDFEANDISSVVFRWDYNPSIPFEDIVEAMCEYLGEYGEFSDEEWHYYNWEGMKQTQFDYGEAFDIEIFGDDGEIWFGLYSI